MPEMFQSWVEAELGRLALNGNTAVSQPDFGSLDEAALEALASLTGHAYWLWTPPHGLRASPNLRALFDVVPEQALEIQALETHLSPFEQALLWRRRGQIVATGRPCIFELSLPERRFLRVEERLVRLKANGVPGLLGVAVDVSDLRRLEDQLYSLNRIESIGLLASSVVHDINNLLSVVCSSSEVLEPLVRRDPSGHEVVTDLRAAGEQCLVLTRQLLTLGSLDNSEEPLCDFEAVVSDLMPTLRALSAGRCGLEVRPANALPKLQIRRGHLEQILLSLVGNARDAAPEGSAVSIDANPVHRAAGTTGRPTAIEITVTDQGVGMDPATLARASEPFFTTKGENGTGLGLATVRMMAERVCGTVDIDSAPGKGTTVTLVIPTEFAAPSRKAADR